MLEASNYLDHTILATVYQSVQIILAFDSHFTGFKGWSLRVRTFSVVYLRIADIVPHLPLTFQP